MQLVNKGGAARQGKFFLWLATLGLWNPGTVKPRRVVSLQERIVSYNGISNYHIFLTTFISSLDFKPFETNLGSIDTVGTRGNPPKVTNPNPNPNPPSVDCILSIHQPRTQGVISANRPTPILYYHYTMIIPDPKP